MKIVTFFESLKIWWGVEKVQATVGSILHEQWHDVIYLVMEDIVPRNEYKWTIVSLKEKFIFGFWLRKILSMFRLWKKVSEFCRQEKVNIILWQWDFFFMAVSVSKWLYRNPAKCVGVVHTTIGVWNPIIKYFLIFLLKKLDFIILISHTEARTFITQYWFSREKCRVIYNSLRIKNIEIKEEEPIWDAYKSLFSSNKFIFINIGRCTYQKNQSLLLSAFEEVHKMHLNTQLIILGEWKLRNELEKQRDSLSSKDEIHFLGNQANIYPFLKRSNCFVLSSKFEGFPMVLIEVAVLWGIPILSTDCPTWPSELLDKKYLSTVDKKDELIKNMIQMMTDFSYREENIHLLARKKHLFSYEVIALEWDRLIETLSYKYHISQASQKS